MFNVSDLVTGKKNNGHTIANENEIKSMFSVGDLVTGKVGNGHKIANENFVGKVTKVYDGNRFDMKYVAYNNKVDNFNCNGAFFGMNGNDFDVLWSATKE